MRHILPRPFNRGFVLRVSLMVDHVSFRQTRCILPRPFNRGFVLRVFIFSWGCRSISGFSCASASITRLDDECLAESPLAPRNPSSLKEYRTSSGDRHFENSGEKAEWRVQAGPDTEEPSRTFSRHPAGAGAFSDAFDPFEHREGLAVAGALGEDCARQLSRRLAMVAPLGGQRRPGCAGSGGRRFPCPGWRTAPDVAGPGSAASSARPRPTRPAGGGSPPCGTEARRLRGRGRDPRHRSAARRPSHPSSGVPARSGRTASA